MPPPGKPHTEEKGKKGSKSDTSKKQTGSGAAAGGGSKVLDISDDWLWHNKVPNKK